MQVVGGSLALADPIPLPGQSLARVDLRRTGVPALPPLTLASDPSFAKTCLLPQAATTTTTSTAAPDPSSTTTTTTAVTAAVTTTAAAVTPAFTG